jgi:hypothetical protein
MHHGLDPVLAKYAAHELSIARISYDERSTEEGRTEARREVVEDYYVFVALTKLTNHVTADVSGAACDENAHVAIEVVTRMLRLKGERLAWMRAFGERICVIASELVWTFRRADV